MMKLMLAAAFTLGLAGCASTGVEQYRAEQPALDLKTYLNGTLDARGKVLVKLNVSDDCYEAVLAVLPSAKSPTVSQLAAGSTEGVFDAEKVQRISDAIRDGKFVVNADAIADKLIANAQELMGNVPKR